MVFKHVDRNFLSCNRTENGIQTIEIEAFIPAKVTDEELASYENIDFDVEDYKNDLKTAKLVNDKDKVKTLMARWRFPSLSLHGIEGAFSDPGSKTVIPRKVIGESLMMKFL